MDRVHCVWEVGYDEERLLAIYRDGDAAEAAADEERRLAGDNGWMYVTSSEEVR